MDSTVEQDHTHTAAPVDYVHEYDVRDRIITIIIKGIDEYGGFFEPRLRRDYIESTEEFLKESRLGMERFWGGFIVPMFPKGISCERAEWSEKEKNELYSLMDVASSADDYICRHLSSDDAVPAVTRFTSTLHMFAMDSIIDVAESMRRFLDEDFSPVILEISGKILWNVFMRNEMGVNDFHGHTVDMDPETGVLTRHPVFDNKKRLRKDAASITLLRDSLNTVLPRLEIDDETATMPEEILEPIIRESVDALLDGQEGAEK